MIGLPRCDPGSLAAAGPAPLDDWLSERPVYLGRMERIRSARTSWYRGLGPTQEDIPELIRKLQERKVRHKQRHHRPPRGRGGGRLPDRAASGIGCPGRGAGPGIAVILVGLGFLALEFDRAERLLDRAVIWAERAAERAENTTTQQRVLAGVAGALAVAAFVYGGDPLGHPARADPLSSPLRGRVRLLALALLLAQLHPADLAGERLRQVVHELDLARVGVGRVALAHVVLDLVGQLVARGVPRRAR